MNVKKVIRLRLKDGWIKIGQTGSHRQYVHPTKSGRVTAAGKLSKDLKKKTLKSILRQAGLEDTS